MANDVKCGSREAMYSSDVDDVRYCDFTRAPDIRTYNAVIRSVESSPCRRRPLYYTIFWPPLCVLALSARGKEMRCLERRARARSIIRTRSTRTGQRTSNGSSNPQSNRKDGGTIMGSL